MKRSLYSVVGILVVIVWAFPVYWMATTAVKPGRDMFAAVPQMVPLHPTLANFSRVLDDPIFWQAARNSVIVSACAVALAMVVAFLAALAVARFPFAGRRTFLVVVMVVQMIPHVAIVIPIFLTLGDLQLADTLPGLVVSYLAFALPFAIWTLRGFVAGVPRELEEAALIDGCSRMQAFRRITLPLIFPGLVATSIYTMILAWNEYLLTYFLISSPDKYTLPLWLTHFVGTEGTEFGPLMAGATLIAIPVAVFFAIVQRHLARGLTAGAVKG
ncbi:N,N'-diacetylchitobiose transport system permease protein [Allocatelliglobosispora scoriae]|uniref:N,N'-diacetylchitobiose transport system permease protein n=1 Tax=Allocatelliglobosispora scoriae TaxID=643052 RepID=A0A841C2N9_9ACTN|nr:carbohydrate ABC transporter permease [Allocatelliglobosispora scoriae]MBB5873312.1 N,N'-diacetylchitobiose transport system permease protein [Allocatelliglobosispora scoriae]